MDIKKMIEVTKTFKLLYIEDEVVSRKGVLELLDNFFIDITIAVNGEDGLKKCKEDSFDIVLSDINMPELNGIEMLKRIRKFDNDICVLFLTAHNENKYLSEGINLSVDAFLLKPLNIDNFNLALSKITEKIILKRENLNYRLNLENELKKQREEHDKKLFFDDLTGLYSRYSFFEDIKNIITPIVFIVDINKFKVINQIYGTNSGTKVLKEFANLLLDFTKNSTYKVYRLSADEFIIRDDVESINAEKYEKDMDDFFETLDNFTIDIGNDAISIDVTIGISTSQEDVFECAKIALEYAKLHKKQYAMYSKAIDKRDEEQNALLWKSRTKSAIEDDRVVAVYQPIVDKDANVVKYETLMRLRDEQRTELIAPFYFLNTAIQTGLYNTLSSNIIFDGLHFLEKTKYDLSFNFTYGDIINKSFLEEIELFFKKTPDLGKRAIFEITENEIIEDYAVMRKFIKRFRSYDIRFAIDDFGSGFSNFEYILEIEPDYLKIDGSLIKDIDTNEKSYVLVNAIVDFSHRLGIKVIAEYVHSNEIFQMLKKLDVDEYQGYFFDKPLEKEFLNFK